MAYLKGGGGKTRRPRLTFDIAHICLLQVGYDPRQYGLNNPVITPFVGVYANAVEVKSAYPVTPPAGYAAINGFLYI